MAKKPVKRTVHRSSRSGQFVSEKFAKRHPATTEKQKVREPSKPAARS